MMSFLDLAFYHGCTFYTLFFTPIFSKKIKFQNCCNKSKIFGVKNPKFWCRKKQNVWCKNIPFYHQLQFLVCRNKRSTLPYRKFLTLRNGLLKVLSQEQIKIAQTAFYLDCLKFCLKIVPNFLPIFFGLNAFFA